MSALALEGDWVRDGLILRHPNARTARRARRAQRAADGAHRYAEQKRKRAELMAWWAAREAEETAWADRAERDANLATFQRWSA